MASDKRCELAQVRAELRRILVEATSTCRDLRHSMFNERDDAALIVYAKSHLKTILDALDEAEGVATRALLVRLGQPALAARAEGEMDG